MPDINYLHSYLGMQLCDRPVLISSSSLEKDINLGFIYNPFLLLFTQIA